VQHELDRIENRRLPRAVDPAKQHNRPAPSRRFHWRKIEYLPALEEPKVAERKLLENHEALSFSRGPKRIAGDHARGDVRPVGITSALRLRLEAAAGPMKRSEKVSFPTLQREGGLELAGASQA